MKKIYLFSCLILAIFLLSSAMAKAATITSAKTGNWSNASTWTAIARTGTISYANESTAVTGTNTLFTTELAAGSIIITTGDGAITRTVASITDNTHLTLTFAANSSQNDKSYTAQVVPKVDDDVIIAASHSVTVDGIFSCASLTVNTTAGSANLIFNNGSVLTVSGNVVLGGTGSSGYIFMILGGILNVGGNFTGTNPGAFFCGIGTVDFNGAAQTVLPVTFNNLTLSGSGIKTFATTPRVNGKLSMEGTATVDVATGVVTYGPSATLQYNTATARTASSKEWINSFTASGGIIITNTGPITLDANKAANVPLKISAGATLNLNTYTLSNPTLTLECGAGTGSSISGTGTLTLGGNVTVNNAAEAGTSGATILCPVALGAIHTFTVADDGTTATDLSVSGVISDAYPLTKAGTGTMVLSGANTYTGLTTISEGTLKLGAAGGGTNTPLGTTDSGTSVTSGATLDLNGFTLGTAEALTLNGTGISSGGALTNSSATEAGYSGLITLGSTGVSIVTNSGDISITNTGTISGSGYALTLGGSGNGSVSSIIGTGTGTVTKSGTGTWTLSGASTYTGLTTISTGTLRLGAAGDATNTPLGTIGSETTITAGAALDLKGYTLATEEALTLNGTGISGGGALMNSGAAATYSGLIMLGSASSIVGGTGTITISNAGTISGSGLSLTLGGEAGGTLSSILGTGTGTLTKADAGIWTLSGANIYTGNSTITSGILQYGITNAISNSSNIVLNGGTYKTGSGAGFPDEVGTLNLSDNSTISLGTGSHTLTFANSSAVGWTSGKLLTITGWKGTPPGTSGTEGKIFFGTSISGLMPDQLAQILFLISGSYYTATILSTGEVVPSSIISITTSSISGSPFCAGAPLSVPFTIAGTFGSGNVFTAQLSDATGNFTSPVAIGTLISTSAGTISATIPIGYPTGTGYRIRVISSTPGVTGSDNGTNLAINATLSVVSISPADAQSICATGTGVQLTVSETGGATIISRQWGKRAVSGETITDISGETGNTYTPSGAVLGVGTWYVVCTSTPTCGSPTVSNEVTATVVTTGGWLGGTTDWNTPSNWCGGSVPDPGTDVVIPSTPLQPIISGSFGFCNSLIINTGATLSVNSGLMVFFGTSTNNGTLTVNSGGYLSMLFTLTNSTGGILTVNGGGQATVNTLENNGTLNLNSTSSSAIFSLMMESYSGSGTVNAKIFLTGGGSPNYNWHYVAVPFVSGLSKTYFTDVNAYNLLAYDNSRVSTSDFQGWLWHNGEAHGGLAASAGFTTLSYGSGYDFYNGSDVTVTLSSTTSLGTILGSSVSLQYSGSGSAEIRGYNLLGNSLTCSIDWDNVVFYGSVGQTVYYTTGNNWAAYLKGAGGTFGATSYIPPLQGFFVKANETGAYLDLSGTKVHSSQARYKKSGTDQADTKEKIIYPKIKLELNGTGTSDETIVWFNDEATTGYDEKYDGYKLFSSEASFGQLYSTLGGTNYVINGISLPSDSTIVPLGVKIAQAGSYSILKKVLEELDNYNVYLIDKANGNYTVDLKKSDKYTFSSDAGTFTDRFVLKFASLTTSAESPSVNNMNFNIYGTEGVINILPPDDFAGLSDGVVKIYDLTGRIVKQSNGIGLYSGSLVQIPFTGRHGIYIVEITSGLSRYKGKVSVR